MVAQFLPSRLPSLLEASSSHSHLSCLHHSCFRSWLIYPYTWTILCSTDLGPSAGVWSPPEGWFDAHTQSDPSLCAALPQSPSRLLITLALKVDTL